MGRQMSDLTGSNWALESASLVELSVNRLREEILSGVLAPGERLVEEHLTRRFGISRAPLREALRLLGQQGLVEHLPRRGARVARLSRTDVDELFSLRDVLERFVVETALPVKDKTDLRELEATLESMASAAASGARFQEARAHCRFHVALAALAGHRQLLLVYEPIILKLQFYMAANLRREAEQRSPGEGVRRHLRLFEAVAAGQPEAVLAELTLHGSRDFFP